MVHIISWCAPKIIRMWNWNAQVVLSFWLFFPPRQRARLNMLNPSPVKHSWLRPARPLIVTRQFQRGPVVSTAGWIGILQGDYGRGTTRIWWDFFGGKRNRKTTSKANWWTCKERTLKPNTKKCWVEKSLWNSIECEKSQFLWTFETNHCPFKKGASHHQISVGGCCDGNW